LREKARAAGFSLHPCTYDASEQRKIINRFIDLLPENLEPSHAEFSSLMFDILLAFNEIAPMLKHPAFSEEQEWRVVKALGPGAGVPLFRAAPALIVPYLSLSIGPDISEVIADVIVGPQTEQWRTMQGARLLFKCAGVESYIVHPSEIPYRSME